MPRTEKTVAGLDSWHLDLLKHAEELANFGVWQLNLRTNELKWSDQVYRIHGVSPEEYTPDVESAIEFYHPDDRSKVESYVRRAIETGEEFEFELRLINKHAQERIVYSHAKLKPAQDDTRILFGTFQDMTDSYIMHEKNKQEMMIQKLTYSNADLERFAYACSHDLQQPMRIVQSFAMMLQERCEDQLDEKGKEYMQYILKSIDQSRSLMRDVLELSRVESDAVLLEPVDLKQLVEDICVSLKDTIEEIDVKIKVEPLPVVQGSRSLFYQLFSNLIFNAIKFRQVDVAAVIEVSFSQEPNHIRFSVIDNGIGIEEKHRKDLFKQFKRLNNQSDYPGSGLGLSICKKVVEKYGGEIWCETAPEGQGSSFSLRLPASLMIESVS